MLGIQAKEFNLCFIRPENLVFHDLRILQVPFSKLQVGCHVPFTEEWLPSCCRGGCPSGRFSHLYRGTLDMPLKTRLDKIENCLMPSLRMTNTIRETFVSMGSTGAKSLETRDDWVFVGAGYMNGQSPLKKYMKHNVETNVYDGWPGVVEMGGCILRKSRERGIRWLHGRVPLQSCPHYSICKTLHVDA
uniref:Uncharacterized protein n=1 Tax=Oncorhynchus tshawytscha TaxID=74940 RepID=A0A8C8K8D9_ONCTS